MLAQGGGACQARNSGSSSLLDKHGITSSQGVHGEGAGAPNNAISPGMWSYEEFLSKTSSLFEENLPETKEYSIFRGDQRRAGIAEALFNAGMSSEFWKWDNCHRKAILFKCRDCEKEFFLPFRCDLRICPECNRRYFAKFKARYLSLLRQLMKRKKGKDRAMFLTVTTKNTGEIPEGPEIQAHNKAIGKLIRKFFKGGVSVNEVKETFLHSHCIVYGPYVHQSKLSQEWEGLTGAKVVDIREIKQKTQKVVDYLGKYIKKPYGVEDSQEGYSLAVQFLKNFKGVRRVHSFGIFYAAAPHQEKSLFVCPYCGSDDFEIIWDAGRSMTECKITGNLSYKQVLRAWDTPIQEGLHYAVA